MEKGRGQPQDVVYRLHQLVFLLDKIADQTLQTKLGFGFSQFWILMAINRYPGVSQLKIAKSLDLTQAAISKQLSGMVSAGLISRVENPKNRRERILRTTAKGGKALEASFKVLDKKMMEIFGILDKDEKDQLSANLIKLINLIHGKGVEHYCRC